MTEACKSAICRLFCVLGRADWFIKVLNAYLDLLQAKVYEAYRSLIDQDEPVTVDRIKAILVGSSKERGRIILEVFQHHNDQVVQLVGIEFAAGTLIVIKSPWSIPGIP